MFQIIFLLFLVFGLSEAQVSEAQASDGQKPYIFDLPPLQLQPLQLRLLNPSSSSLILVKQNESIPIETYSSGSQTSKSTQNQIFDAFTSHPNPKQSVSSYSSFGPIIPQTLTYLPRAFQPFKPLSLQSLKPVSSQAQTTQPLSSTPKQIAFPSLTPLKSTFGQQITQSSNQNNIPKESSVEYERPEIDSILNDLSMYVPIDLPAQGVLFQQMVPIQTNSGQQFALQVPEKNTRFLPPVTLPAVSFQTNDQSIQTFNIELPTPTDEATDAKSDSPAQQPLPILAQPLSTPAQPLSTPGQPLSTPAQPLSTPAQPLSTPAQPLSTFPQQLAAPLQSTSFKSQTPPQAIFTLTQLQSPAPTSALSTIAPIEPLQAVPAPTKPSPPVAGTYTPFQLTPLSLRPHAFQSVLFEPKSIGTLNAKQFSVPRVQAILIPQQKSVLTQPKQNAISGQNFYFIQNLSELGSNPGLGLTVSPGSSSVNNANSLLNQEFMRTSIKRSITKPSIETQLFNRQALQTLLQSNGQKNYNQQIVDHLTNKLSIKKENTVSQQDTIQQNRAVATTGKTGDVKELTFGSKLNTKTVPQFTSYFNRSYQTN